MRVKTIVDEDFVNYQKPSMFIGTISCGGKCCIEGGFPLSVCQNDGWRGSAPIDIRDRVIIERYLHNDISRAIVFGGLEPMEQSDELFEFIDMLRNTYKCDDDVVIYCRKAQHPKQGGAGRASEHSILRNRFADKP